MKKILIIALTLVLALGSAQAQKKNTKVSATPKSSNGNTTAITTKSAPKLIDLPPADFAMDMPLQKALAQRRTIRDLSEEELSNEMISSLLWATYGFNRKDEQKRVVPSAVNVQEFDIYLFTRDGIYLYLAEKNCLELILTGDHRADISSQKHFAVAPVSIVMVANYERMKAFKTEADRDFYAAVDAGYVSQNIYLFCASADLGTVACGGINRDTIHKLLKITNGKAILAHPVGRPL